MIKTLTATGVDFRLLEAVIQNSNDSVVVTSIEPGSNGVRRITWVNTGFERITGYSAAQAIGQRARFLFDTSEDPKGLEALRDATRQQRIVHTEMHLKRRDGTPYWLELSLVPVAAGDLESQPIVTIGREITHRKQAEEALRRSEQRFKDFAEVASDWFWEQDADLRFTYLSHSVIAVTGQSVGEIIGRTREELYLQDPDDTSWLELRRRLEAHEPFENFRYSVAGPDGKVRHRMISGRPTFDAEGVFRGYRGVGRDVTAEVDAERRATEAESQLRDALDSINEGFTLYDKDDVLILQNRRSVMFYPELAEFIVPGVKYGDIMRKVAYSGRIPSAIGREEQWLEERMARHRAGGGAELERQFADGRWVKISERPTSNGGVVIIQADITEMKQRQQALLASEAAAREAREAAEAANRAKSAFLASMSHELRTPLNAILGFAETMSTEMFGRLGSPKYVEYASDIHRSGSHLLDLINDILDLSRIEAGRYELSLEAVKPKAVIEEAVRLVSVNAARAGVELVIETAADLPSMLLDRRAVRQVLLNLLSNAIKFTPRGGRVSVAASVGPGNLTIVVADTGVGIPEGALSRLARPFEQVENVMTRRNEGSGLGLAISKALVEFHRGSLQIDSVLDRGTTVTVELPFIAADA